MLFCMAGCNDDPYYPGGSGSGSNPPAYDSFSYDADGLTVSFTADVPSDVYSCEWSFGDGTTGYGKKVSHTYSSERSYYVTLTATSAGGERTYSEYISVEKEEPTSVIITSLILRQFPAKNGNVDWDLLDKPDVYFKIVDNYQTYYTSPTKLNIDNNDLPVTFTNIYCTLHDLQSAYRFEFYDEDDFGTDPTMFSAIWRPSTENDDYSSSYDWVNYSSSIRFTINLSWYSSKGEELYTKEADFVGGKCVSDDPEVLDALGLNK